jgi:hypothetical protein
MTLIGNVYFALGGGTTTVRDGASSYTSLAALHAAGFEKHGGIDYGVYGDPLLSNPSGAPTTGTLPGAPVSVLDYFDIGSSSPARNAGIDYALLGIDPGNIDFRGRGIPRESAYDAGAVEYQAAVVATPRGRGASGVPVFG